VKVTWADIELRTGEMIAGGYPEMTVFSSLPQPASAASEAKRRVEERMGRAP
jgi:hypothetical protein